MVNFLKGNPHKFDIKICEGFLEKIGVEEEFKEIVEHYMADWQTKVDLTSVNTFVSETNAIDISNRSLLKSMDSSSRKIQIKRASDINTMLRCLQEEPPQPSRHIKKKKIYQRSCPRLQNVLARTEVLNAYIPRYKSQQLKTLRSTPVVSSRLGQQVKSIELLYINEITQALSFQSLIFKPSYR